METAMKSIRVQILLEKTEEMRSQLANAVHCPNQREPMNCCPYLSKVPTLALLPDRANYSSLTVITDNVKQHTKLYLWRSFTSAMFDIALCEWI